MSYEEEKNALKEEFDVKFAALVKEEDAAMIRGLDSEYDVKRKMLMREENKRLKALKEKDKKLELACFEKTEFLELLDRNILSCSIPLEIMGEKIYQLFVNKEKRKKIYIEPLLEKRGE